jgi:hypothetical protein
MTLVSGGELFLTPEELLAGKDATFDIEVPADVAHPMADGRRGGGQIAGRVRLRPLTVKDVQLIAKAAKDDEVLTSVLMIQRALVEPQLKQHQVGDLPSGLVGFLIDRINRISGLNTDDDEMRALLDSPLVRAFFVLAREFSWTPEQVREMTVGQILGYLELVNQTGQVGRRS